MSYGLLNLNDHRIEFFDGDTCALETSAHVIFQPKTLLTGPSAQAQLRINPTLAYSKHWQQLDQSARKLPHQNFRHHADIAYHQLGQWFEGVAQKPLVVASSFGYSAEQYALLAGLLQAHKHQAIGFCDSGLLHLSGYSHLQLNRAPLTYFLDFSLHNARLLAFGQQQGQLILLQQWDFPEAGIFDLQNTWLKVIAQACIRQTRYDPLHSATSEQRLYSQLPRTFQALAQTEAMELDVDGKKVELLQADLLALNETVRQKIRAQVGAAPLLLSQHAQLYSGLPGIALSSQHLQQAVTAQEDFFKQQTSLKHHTSLPLTGQSCVSNKKQDTELFAPSSNQPVTHLLDQHIALRLEESIELYQIGARLSYKTTEPDSNNRYLAELKQANTGWEIHPKTNTLTLNGTALTSPSALKLGDNISASDADNYFTCIGLAGAHDGS